MRTCDLEGCEKPHRARGLCSTHYNEQRQPNRYRKVIAVCAHCGVPVAKNNTNEHKRRFCSMACRRARWAVENADERASRSQVVLHEGPAGSCEVPRSHPARRRDIPITGPSVVLVAGDCTRCGKSTVVRIPLAVGTAFELTCSDSCSKGQSKDRRRARQRAAFVEPVYRKKVFERDGWVCQICGEPVARDQKVPHPLAPTVDHTVPLAPYLGRAGGEHSMANVQTAHFLCNSQKSHLV